MKQLCLVAATMFIVSDMHADSVPLLNADFEEGVASFPDGFDADPDIPGWFDLTPIADSGVEGPGAWWGTYNNSYSAFMQVGDGAYHMSEYTVQEGDEYTVSFVGKSWNNGNSEWTVTLFYDDPANVIGSFVTAVDGTWTEYSSPVSLAATQESVGGTLGISFLNSGSQFANLDNVSVAVIPEPSTLSMIAVLCGVILFVRRRMKE